LASIVVSTHGPLTIRREDYGDTLAIRAIGDLDIATAPALETSLLHAFEGDASSIVVDLTEIRFIDGFGVRVVQWAQEHSRGEPDRIRIAGSAVVRRVIPSR
jgi:anti-anti-sigma factor